MRSLKTRIKKSFSYSISYSISYSYSNLKSPIGHIPDNKTVLGSSRKLKGAAEHLIDDSEKRICRLSFEF